MRDKNQNYIKFYKQFEKVVEDKLQVSRLLRTTVTDSPTFLTDDSKIIYPRTFRELRGLTVIHYYLPRDLMWEVKLGLEALNLNHLNKKQIIEINILLSSKDNMIKYYHRTKRYTTNEVFGNIVKDAINASRLKIVKRSIKVEKPIRKRGYSDKGSLRPKEKWLPSHDYSLTNLQNEIEIERTKLDKSINRIIDIIENYDF